MTDFLGKRALVVGGTAGIGRAIAAALAKRGAKVAIVARTRSTLQRSAADLGSTTFFECDLSSEQAASQLAKATLDEFGGLDILVLSSGFYLSGQIAEAEDGAFTKLFESNVLGPCALARFLAPALAAASGDILIVNSTVVRAQNLKGRAYFAAGQQALKTFFDGLRDELSESGVRVTSLFPGTTATPRQERLHASEGKPYKPERLLQPMDVASIALSALAMPDTAEVTDIVVRPRYKA